MMGSDEWSLVVAGLAGVAVVASYGLAWYSWQRTEHPVSNRFAALLVADGTWALITFLGFGSPTDALARLWELGIGCVGALAGVLWFMFVVEYTGDSDWIPPLVERVAVGQAVVYGVAYALLFASFGLLGRSSSGRGTSTGSRPDSSSARRWSCSWRTSPSSAG